MLINYEAYRQEALKAVSDVFVKEYKNSIGIPFPKIDFVLPDSDLYNTGQYYTSILDETWQIHLNFGLLPKSYKDFREEVHVLTRHEVGHYMCCPFDVITHLRMLKTVIDIFNKYYASKFPSLDIIKLSGSLSNQVSDIIVDTVNFQRNKTETLKSEIAWIKKGANFNSIPQHNKLMFLMKQALWKESLELEETNEELISEVKSLSEQFENGGIENKNLFSDKLESYTHVFFKLFEQDIIDQQGDENPQNQQPSPSPSKDSQQNGGQLVFLSPDTVQDSLIELAQETSTQMFSQILSAAGFSSLSENDKEKIWFEAQSVDMIPIEDTAPMGSNDDYSYPTSWKLGDPIDEIDMMLTYTTSQFFIPGVTTKKWEKNTLFDYGAEKKQLDLLLIIDTSGSMGNVIDSQSNMHQAVLASYGLINYFEFKQGQVALIGFSDRITADIEWTKHYDEVKEKLLINGHGGTNFPMQKVQSEIEKSKNTIVTVVITDGEINNIKETIDFFKDYLSEGNMLHIFLQTRDFGHYEELKNYGAKIIVALTAAEICETVLNDVCDN